MSAVNQLILDCAAKVLRINETTNAEISLSIEGHIHAIKCDGYKQGYYFSPEVKLPQGDIGHTSDYLPLKELPCGWIDLTRPNAESNLRALLESLNALEKELISNA